MVKCTSLVGVLLTATAAIASASLPNVDKIRGVNLGGWLVSEPWMMSSEWTTMGCHGQKSEFDCMKNVPKAQAGFTKHYNTWITEKDIKKIASFGLNTIRIPLGYWIVESTVDRATEHFPTGGFPYLRRVCGWAKKAGLNVVLDLHGAPGAQDPNQPFTGQYIPSAGFYSSNRNYARAYAFLANITTEVHRDPGHFGTVFGLEVLNEPIQGASKVGNMVSKYFMDKLWWSGEPTTNLPNLNNVFFDDHTYVKYTQAVKTRQGYMDFSCTQNVTRQIDSPVVVGEWSLSPDGDNTNPEFTTTATDAASFYFNWASAQMIAYEKAAGWIFWSWKTTLGDPRWDYQIAVSQGYLPSTASAYNAKACQGY